MGENPLTVGEAGGQCSLVVAESKSRRTGVMVFQVFDNGSCPSSSRTLLGLWIFLLALGSWLGVSPWIWLFLHVGEAFTWKAHMKAFVVCWEGFYNFGSLQLVFTKIEHSTRPHA